MERDKEIVANLLREAHMNDLLPGQDILFKSAASEIIRLREECNRYIDLLDEMDGHWRDKL